MEKRNVEITLDKAREWYNSSDESLKEIALQAFTEEEITAMDFTKVKDMYDVIHILGISTDKYLETIKRLEGTSKSLAAFYKVGLIRKTLNKGYNMEFTKGSTYYPNNLFIAISSTHFDPALKKGVLKEIAKFEVNRRVFRLLSGKAINNYDEGLGTFYPHNGVGYAYSSVGFLGCATGEIAKHMSMYFAKEIFEAKYSDYIDIKWL